MEVISSDLPETLRSASNCFFFAKTWHVQHSSLQSKCDKIQSKPASNSLQRLNWKVSNLNENVFVFYCDLGSITLFVIPQVTQVLRFALTEFINMTVNLHNCEITKVCMGKYVSNCKVKLGLIFQ